METRRVRLGSVFGKRVLRFPNAFAFQELFFFFFLANDSKSTVHVLCGRQILLFIHCLHTVHGTHNHFIQKKIFKMSLTVLFTHLKIILLQCFSVFSFNFQLSTVSKRTRSHSIKQNVCPCLRLFLVKFPFFFFFFPKG